MTRILPGVCAKAPAPIQPPAAQPALPAASISRTNTRPPFPCVAIHASQPGRITTPAELEALGLVAPPEIVVETPPSPLPVSDKVGRRRWPSYERCLDGAPLNSEETGPDTSRADFVWCMTAITWGWSVEETAERLMEESAKAQMNSKAYAELTSRNAGLAVERRRQSYLVRAADHRR